EPRRILVEDADDLHALLFHVDEQRVLQLARRAPGGPEIDQHGTAGEIRQTHLPALESWNVKLRRRPHRRGKRGRRGIVPGQPLEPDHNQQDECRERQYGPPALHYASSFSASASRLRADLRRSIDQPRTPSRAMIATP